MSGRLTHFGGISLPCRATKCRRCYAPLDADRAAGELALGVVNWNVCGPCAYAEANPPDEANTTPEAFFRHLTAAHGFLELGMPHDAWNELEEIEPPPRRVEVPVLGMRMAVFQALEKRGAMAEVCRHLVTVEPGRVLLGRLVECLAIELNLLDRLHLWPDQNLANEKTFLAALQAATPTQNSV